LSAPQPIRVASRPIQNPLAAWRELEGQVVIISPEDSVLHELNDTASFIWKLSTGEHGLEEIARRLAQEFEVDEATALADTHALVAELCAKRLLLPSAADGEPGLRAAEGVDRG
jgi:hypothetical protein